MPEDFLSCMQGLAVPYTMSVMGFFEEVAAALDVIGVESRFQTDTLFVPVNDELELHFVAIEPTPVVPGAEVYLVDPQVADEAPLVGVVFTVEAAVEDVIEHIATDVMVGAMDDLLMGDDDRLADLEFFQDADDPMCATAEVGEVSLVEVTLSAEGVEMRADVCLVVEHEDAEAGCAEVIHLGQFADLEVLYDVLATTALFAQRWEELLVPLEDEFDAEL